MRLLSILSILNAYNFILLSLYHLHIGKKETVNRMASVLDVCLAFWSLSGAFFFSAKTAEQAGFWHIASVFGWLLFFPVLVHFFMELARTGENYRKIRLLAIYAPPAVLIIRSLLTGTSPVAKGYVQSRSGLGWTYVSDGASPWYWFCIALIAVYMACGIMILCHWIRVNKGPRFWKQARTILPIAGLFMVLGVVTDLLLPVFWPVFPPIFCILSAALGVAILYIMRAYKFLAVYEVADSDLIFDTVMDPILLLDRNGIVVKCNQATGILLKRNVSEIIGRPLREFCKFGEYDPVHLEKLLGEKKLDRVEIDLVDAQGKTVNAMASVSVAEDRLDGFVGVVANLHDVTEYKRVTRTLTDRAYYDKLTGIPNRRYFLEKIDASLDEYKENGSEFAVVYFDLDGFKKVNDVYGHDVGDKVLKEVVSILRDTTRKQDVFARIGGDEFAMIFSSLSRESDPGVIVKRMEERLSQPLSIDGNQCQVGLSYGISKCPEDGEYIGILLKTADARMYEAKAAKKSAAGKAGEVGK